MGEVRRRGQIWWLRYYREGQRHEESSRSRKKGDAERLLKLREGDVIRGVPVTAKIGQLRFEEAATDLLTDYRVNGRSTTSDTERRIRLHLRPRFGKKRLASLTTSDIRRHIESRQNDNAANASINRELAILKRMFSLAIASGKLLHCPHIPMLIERNVREGFFERHEFEAIVRQVPDEIAMLLRFAYITGWRIPSEVQTLQWRQVDLEAGEVRLNPGTTKNQQGRTFSMAHDDLRDLLHHQRTVADRLQHTTGTICPWVFHRNGQPIKSFRSTWKKACLRAGYPGRIPHDLRRTAVRNLVRAGVSESIAMTMTGHLTRSVFDRYDIVSSRDLRNAAALLNEHTGLGFRGRLGKETLTDRDNSRDNQADLAITHRPQQAVSY